MPLSNETPNQCRDPSNDRPAAQNIQYDYPRLHWVSQNGGDDGWDEVKRQPSYQYEELKQVHRSHSPKTTSMADRTAVVSASMWPFIMKSIAWRWLNAVGRILQR